MEEKYILDLQGLITLLSELSDKIINKTSGTIEFDDLDELINPNNFVTAGAIKLYLKDRKSLIINLQSTSVSENSDYIVETNTVEYNGDNEELININVIPAESIRRLFN